MLSSSFVCRSLPRHIYLSVGTCDAPAQDNPNNIGQAATIKRDCYNNIYEFICVSGQ